MLCNRACIKDSCLGFDHKLLSFLLATVIIVGIVLAADYHDLFDNKSHPATTKTQKDENAVVAVRGVGGSNEVDHLGGIQMLGRAWKA